MKKTYINSPNPKELHGVKKNPFPCLLGTEKYGLSIWMEYINIRNWFCKS